MVRVAPRKRRARGTVVERRSTKGSFFSGLLLGFGVATLTHEDPSDLTRYSSGGLRDDWRAVGNDLRGAMRQVANGKRA